MSDTNNKTDWKARERGAVWKRKNAKDETYLSLKITIEGQDYDFVAYGNRFKAENENAPDFRVYISEPRQGQTQAQTGARTQSVPRTTPRPTQARTTPAKPVQAADNELF